LTNQPIKEAPDHNQGTIDGGDRLPLIPMQMVAKVSHVPKRDPFHHKRFSVGLAEPADELPQVVLDGSAGVVGEIVAGQVAHHEGWLFGSDRQALKNIIVRILALFWAGIRHHIGASFL
jgi:hypothetical protein